MDALTYRILQLSYKHRLAHIGSCLTAVDILDEIYRLRKPEEPVIVSAGHVGVALYAVLEKHLKVDAEELLKRHGVHPTKAAYDGIWCSTGSLGQGLSVAVGRALANRDRDVWVYLTDGECAEGVVFESLAFARRVSLWNLQVYCGWNGYGAYREASHAAYTALKGLFPMEIRHAFVHRETDIPFLVGQHAHYHVMTESDWAWVEANAPQKGTA